jgi:hypothetical protein
MSFRIWRLGGTILPTRFMVKTYWDTGTFGISPQGVALCRATLSNQAVTASSGLSEPEKEIH